MKRLIAIILSCIALSVNATKVYVSSTGSDATGNGSLSNPYALVSYACTQASAGDTVFVLAGTIDQGTTQIVKPVGVSILGEGNTSIIITNFTHTSALQAAIQCASTAGSTTNDNSSISHIRLNGNNLTASRAIYVGYRNNINIHNCTIEDFNVSGIYLDASQDTYPDLFLTGISIHDCVINNCADRTVGYDGCIRARGTDGLQICNLLIDMTSRPTGNNGISIAAYRNKRMKIHNNVFHRNDHEITSTGVHRWNFFFEEHAGRGENDFYNNTLYGLAKISIGGISKRDNDCSYLWKVRYNNFLNNANGNRNYNGGEQTIYCINIEGDGKNGVEVSYNFIQRFAIGIELSTPTSGGGSFWQQNWSWTGISVHHNIIENCGYADFLYGSFGLWWINESNVSPFSGSFSNILISNNVMTGNNGGSYNSHTGIRIDGNSSITGLHVVNNIVIGFQNNIHVGDHGTDGVVYNNLQITHNLGHLNGSSDISVEAGASIVYNNCDTSTGNITADPQFASTTTYELSSSSPAIDAGIDVGLTRDFHNRRLVGVPDIGAIEYGAIGGERFGKNRQGVMLKGRNGRMMIYN